MKWTVLYEPLGVFVRLQSTFVRGPSSLCKSVGRIENWTGDVGPVTLMSKTRCSLRSRMQEWRGVGDVEVGRWKGGDVERHPD
jgi:hypothetical protein